MTVDVLNLLHAAIVGERRQRLPIGGQCWNRETIGLAGDRLRTQHGHAAGADLPGGRERPQAQCVCQGDRLRLGSISILERIQQKFFPWIPACKSWMQVGDADTSQRQVVEDCHMDGRRSGNELRFGDGYQCRPSLQRLVRTKLIDAHIEVKWIDTDLGLVAQAGALAGCVVREGHIYAEDMPIPIREHDRNVDMVRDRCRIINSERGKEENIRCWIEVAARIGHKFSGWLAEEIIQINRTRDELSAGRIGSSHIIDDLNLRFLSEKGAYAEALIGRLQQEAVSQCAIKVIEAVEIVQNLAGRLLIMAL